jgi:hypothetical protein
MEGLNVFDEDADNRLNELMKEYLMIKKLNREVSKQTFSFLLKPIFIQFLLVCSYRNRV